MEKNVCKRTIRSRDLQIRQHILRRNELVERGHDLLKWENEIYIFVIVYSYILNFNVLFSSDHAWPRCVSLQMLTSDEERRGEEQSSCVCPSLICPTFHATADLILHAKRWRESALLQFCLQTWSEALFYFFRPLAASKQHWLFVNEWKYQGISYIALKVWAKSEGWWELQPSPPAEPWLRPTGGETHFWYSLFLYILGTLLYKLLKRLTFKTFWKKTFVFYRLAMVWNVNLNICRSVVQISNTSHTEHTL